METTEFKEVLKATKEQPIRWEHVYQALYMDGLQWRWEGDQSMAKDLNESFDNKDMVWLSPTDNAESFSVNTMDDWRLQWVCEQRGICEESLDRIAFPINTDGGQLYHDGVFQRTICLLPQKT